MKVLQSFSTPCAMACHTQCLCGVHHFLVIPMATKEWLWINKQLQQIQICILKVHQILTYLLHYCSLFCNSFFRYLDIMDVILTFGFCRNPIYIVMNCQCMYLQPQSLSTVSPFMKCSALFVLISLNFLDIHNINMYECMSVIIIIVIMILFSVIKH